MVIITLYNNDGTIAMRRKGSSKRRLKAKHFNGSCHFLCTYCVDEADAIIAARLAEGEAA